LLIEDLVFSLLTNQLKRESKYNQTGNKKTFFVVYEFIVKYLFMKKKTGKAIDNVQVGIFLTF